jgi:hypothetical protein
VIILRLILCDRGTDEGPSCGSRGGTDPRALTGSSSGGTYQRTRGRARDPAESCSLTGGSFTRAKTGRKKNGGRDRWDKMLFHNAWNSNGEVKTDVPAGHSKEL